MEKDCYRCGKKKDVSFFPRERRNKDGLNGTCKECINVYNKSLGCTVETPKEKRCSKCEEVKGSSEFGINKWNKDGIERQCRACKFIPEREYRLQRLYGIDNDEYEAMNTRQNGRCAICGRGPKTKALSVDHCHTTGRVRGLLCWPCNRFLGHIKDDTESLSKMITYLRGC